MPEYCSFCGTRIREDGNFCEGCGREIINNKDWAKEIENGLRAELTKEIEQKVRRELEPLLKKEIEANLREEYEGRINHEFKKKVGEQKKISSKNKWDKIKNSSIVHYILILLFVLIALNIIFFIVL